MKKNVQINKPAPGRKRTAGSLRRVVGHDWTRGYYCAVAMMLDKEGATTAVRELYREGGNPELADEDHKDMFRVEGLMPNN